MKLIILCLFLSACAPDIDSRDQKRMNAITDACLSACPRGIKSIKVEYFSPTCECEVRK